VSGPIPFNYLKQSRQIFLKKLNEKRLLRVIQEINDLENFPFFTVPHDLAKLKGRKEYYESYLK